MAQTPILGARAVSPVPTTGSSIGSDPTTTGIPGSPTDVESALAALQAELAALSGYLTVINGGGGTVFPHGNFGATETIDLADGNYHWGTLNADCTFTFTVIADTAERGFTLELIEDGTGGWSPTWPGTVTWLGGTAPTHTTTAGTTTIYGFFTRDGGTTWIGGQLGGGGSALTIKDEGTPLATPATSLDFVGAGVVASGATAAKTITISGVPTGTAGGDLAGTYPNPTISPAAVATLPASGAHVHVVSETHLSDGSTGTYTLDEMFLGGSVIGWNVTSLARLTVTESAPDQATVSPVGSAGDSIVFDYAAVLV